MIFFQFLIFIVFIVLAIWTGSKFGHSMGQRSLRSGGQYWPSFFAGAAKICAIHAIVAAAMQMLFALDGGFLVSFGVFLLRCAVVPVYAAVIWLPAYSFCFWDTRRSSLKASQR